VSSGLGRAILPAWPDSVDGLRTWGMSTERPDHSDGCAEITATAGRFTQVVLGSVPETIRVYPFQANRPVERDGGQTPSERVRGGGLERMSAMSNSMPIEAGQPSLCPQPAVAATPAGPDRSASDRYMFGIGCGLMWISSS
jgi:hypothetical protein